MIEVFKTNVEEWVHAHLLVQELHKAFSEYKANFDLQDCDRILRVKCITGTIKTCSVIELLKEFGFSAEVLSDDCQSSKGIAVSKRSAWQ